MHRITLIASIFVVWILSYPSGSDFCVAAASPQVVRPSNSAVPATILMSGEMLAKNKVRIAERDPELAPAMGKLVKEAEAALRAGPFSVADNQQIATEADKHDYTSYGRYWWPDPNKPDGLPYIRRDGKTNPDSQSPKHQTVRLWSR